MDAHYYRNPTAESTLENDEKETKFRIAENALKVSFDKKGGNKPMFQICTRENMAHKIDESTQTDFLEFWICTNLRFVESWWCRCRFLSNVKFWEGISGQVYEGTYYGIPVAVKEISDEEEFKHEEKIIFDDQMMHPSIAM